VPRAIGKASDIDECGLSFSELQELWLGPCNGSVFSSPEELRDAWERGRAVVMRLWAHGGKRPMAWWRYEAPALGLEWPGLDRQRSFLYVAGALTAEERTELEREWRREFDAARGRDSTERRAHHMHHDIPRELVKRWSAAARRRRPKAIGKEGDAASIPQPGNSSA
jgi:hypothetical protein